MSSPEPHRPVVTIAALYGAAGTVIGPRVAERLGVPYLDRAIPEAVSKRTGIPPEAIADVDEEPRSLTERLAGGIGVGLAPGSVPAIGIVCFGVLGIGLGTINTLIFALQADTVDYGEWNSGVRAEGGSYAVLSFTRKAGQGIGGGLAAFTIGLGGYVSGAASQSHAAVNSIRVGAGLLPAAFFLGATAVMIVYPLTERAFRRVVRELAERRATADVRGIDEAVLAAAAADSPGEEQ